MREKDIAAHSTAFRLIEDARARHAETSDELELRLMRNIHRLEILCDLTDRLLAGQDPEREVLPAIFAEASAMLGIDGVYHFRLADIGVGIDLTFEAQSNAIDEADEVEPERAQVARSVAELTAARRRPAHHAQIQLRSDTQFDRMRRIGVRCFACQPIAMGRRFFGVICFESRCKDKFASRDLRLFTAIAHNLALAWDRRDKLFELNECNRELQHRVNNMLSNVQAIAYLSARSSRDVGQFVDKLTQRIQALARTNNSLSGGAPRIALRDLLNAELAPYRAPGRIHLGGRAVLVPSHHAVFLGMVIHELTSNAVLHGALSCERGTLSLYWAIDRRPTGQVLVIKWIELGGPAPEHGRSGFGSRLLESAPADHIRVTREYLSPGLQVMIEVRLD